MTEFKSIWEKEIPKKDSNVIVVGLWESIDDKGNSIPYIDIREHYYQDKARKHTSKGLTIPIARLLEFRDAVNDVIAAAQERMTGGEAKFDEVR